MSAITVNAFPPLHTFNSSRSWFLALIVLVHLGFFWALTHGLSFRIIDTGRETWVVDVPQKLVDEDFPKPLPEPTDIQSGRVDPLPLPREVDYRETPSENAPQSEPRPVPTAGAPGSAVPVPPVLIQPQSDPRYPFTEPEYPTAEIRMGHEGTVWLSIEILPNGRVGLVRIDQSSGFVRLDDSAVREAKKWRMKPGMQDGVAIAMWKRVPVTFQLKD
jgi:periplasmic protein TonB